MKSARNTRGRWAVWLCILGPLLVAIAYDSILWMKSTPAENFVRFGFLYTPYDPDPMWDDPAVWEAAVKATASEDESLRANAYQCVRTLHLYGKISDAKARGLLARALRDPNPNTRKHTLWHLRVKTREAPPDETRRTKPEWVFAAGLFDYPYVVEKFKYHVAAVMADPDPELRSWAICRLGEIGGEARFALPDIALALDDPDPRVFTAAQKAVMDITGMRVAPKKPSDVPLKKEVGP